MTSPRHADLHRVQARALGVLTAILIALVVFSFAWYLIVPHVSRVEVEARHAQEQAQQSSVSASVPVD